MASTQAQPKPDRVNVSSWVDGALAKEIRARAKAEHRTPSSLIRIVLAEHFSDKGD